MSSKEIDDYYLDMVSRFLAWKLPEDFAPDAGISFNPAEYQKAEGPHWPTGTNLLHAGQALEMFKQCVEQPEDHIAYISAAVERINATIIVDGESPEQFRKRIASRVADIGKPTFMFCGSALAESLRQEGIAR